jgi:hypothetical protein
VALALFCRVNDVKPGRARAHLATTQSEAFDDALRFVDANEAILEALRTHPASLADGVFAFEEGRSVLGRLFGGKKPSLDDAAPVSKKPAKVRTEAEERKLAETRAMVEEALRAR